MNRPLLEVNGVWKRLCRRPEKALRYALADIGRDIIGSPHREELRDGEFWALQDIDFEIQPGQVVGIIGHNGAGKSTLINLVSGVMLPTLGSITLHTPRVALVDHGGGLNPIETGRENAVTQLALHGVPEDMLAEELLAVEAFAAIGDFIDAPVGTYSVGMRLRLAFSVYSRLKPDLFIIDEALGGGDQRFRNAFQIYLRDYIDGGGAMLLCSHEMFAIQAFCDRCLLLDGGRVVMSGPPVEMVSSYYELGQKREAEQARAAGGRADRRQNAVEKSEQPCVIKSVTVVAEDGGDPRPGGPVIIEIDVAVTEDVEGVACGIEIGRGELQSLATLAGGYPERAFTLRPPLTKICCRIESLPLAPGNYDIRLGLSVPKAAVTLALIGYEDPAVPFAVVPGVDAVSNLACGRQNIVHMPTTWCLPSGQPGESAVE